MTAWILALEMGPCPPGAYSAMVKSGYELRELINNALDAGAPTLRDGILASIGPKLSVMLAYQQEPDPDRVLRIAQALQLVLGGSFRDKRPTWPLRGVITRGFIRTVPVLFGQNWNFEGRPAIAAARILAKLEPGKLAFEAQAATSTVERHLGKPQKIHGKHNGEEYLFRIHTEIHFPQTFQVPMASKSASVTTITDGDLQPDKVLSTWSGYEWQRLDIDVFTPTTGLGPVIHERHQLQVPENTDRMSIPLAVTMPRARATARAPRIDGDVMVSDGFGPLNTRLQDIGGLLSVILPVRRVGRPCVVELFYRPEPLNDRIFIKLPASPNLKIQQSRVVIWGSSAESLREVGAFTVATGASDRGRFPMVAVCSELSKDTHASMYHIDYFEPDCAHELAVPTRIQPPTQIRTPYVPPSGVSGPIGN